MRHVLVFPLSKIMCSCNLWDVSFPRKSQHHFVSQVVSLQMNPCVQSILQVALVCTLLETPFHILRGGSTGGDHPSSISFRGVVPSQMQQHNLICSVWVLEHAWLRERESTFYNALPQVHCLVCVICLRFFMCCRCIYFLFFLFMYIIIFYIMIRVDTFFCIIFIPMLYLYI